MEVKTRIGLTLILWFSSFTAFGMYHLLQRTEDLVTVASIIEQNELLIKEKERAEKAYTQLLKRGELCQ